MTNAAALSVCLTGLEFTIYVKYCVINCTGLNLAMRLLEDCMGDEIETKKKVLPSNTTLCAENHCSEFELLLLDETSTEHPVSVQLSANSSLELLPAGKVLTVIATSCEIPNLGGQVRCLTQHTSSSDNSDWLFRLTCCVDSPW